DRELAGENRELPHLLEGGEVSQRGLHALLEGGDDLGMGDRLGPRLRADAEIRAETREGLPLRHQKGGDEAAGVADDDRLADQPRGAEGAFERLRRDVLAA